MTLHNSYNFNIELPVDQAKPSFSSLEFEKRITVSFQLKNIIRRLTQIVDPFPRLSIVYTILFTVAASSGLTIITLVISQELPPWVFPLYGCVFIFSLLCGTIFLYVDIKLRATKRSEMQDILIEMKELEETIETVGMKSMGDEIAEYK